jgi:hypothetical protein
VGERAFAAGGGKPRGCNSPPPLLLPLLLLPLLLLGNDGENPLGKAFLQ